MPTLWRRSIDGGRDWSANLMERSSTHVVNDYHLLHLRTSRGRGKTGCPMLPSGARCLSGLSAVIRLYSSASVDSKVSPSSSSPSPPSACGGPRTWVDESGSMTGHAPWVGVDVGRCGWSANLGRRIQTGRAGRDGTGPHQSPAIFDESICWVRPCRVCRFGFVDHQGMGSLQCFCCPP